MDFQLNYDELIHFDAEDLAECGIAESYESLAPKLKEMGVQPEPIEEIIDHNEPRYAVRFRNTKFLISAPELGLSRRAEGQSWARATQAFFEIVNAQLLGQPVKLYAINGGNDLFGMFLTPEQADASRKGLSRRDWPYLPTAEPPWYGLFH